MRIAVISDIHGNYDALLSVLISIDHSSIDSIVCLGDCIGYGAEPELVIRTLQDRQIPSILGNHEQAVLEREHLARFNPLARESLLKTISMLSETTLGVIKEFPTSMVLHDGRFVHGFPPDSVTTYSFELSPGEKRQVLEKIPESVCFFGHTHELGIIEYDGHTLTESRLDKKKIPILPNYQYAVNVGSIGQPRDGNKDAKYVVWDKGTATLEVNYISYNNKAAAEKIIAAGLPEIHARKLL
jgi:predicted phosphodiesterase